MAGGTPLGSIVVDADSTPGSIQSQSGDIWLSYAHLASPDGVYVFELQNMPLDGGISFHVLVSAFFNSSDPVRVRTCMYEMIDGVDDLKTLKIYTFDSAGVAAGAYALSVSVTHLSIP